MKLRKETIKEIRKKKRHFYLQESPYTCGPAAMRMALMALGIKKSEKQLSRLLKTSKERGTPHSSFPLLAEKEKFNFVVKRNATTNEIKSLFSQDYQIIVCYLHPEEKFGHFSVVKNIDERNIYLLDPEFGPNYSFSLKQFLKLWKDSENNKRWFIAMKKP